MSREYAKVYVSIRDDADFSALTPAAQSLYFQLLIGDISKAGVVWWRPKKLAGFFGGTTAADVEAMGVELVGRRFLVIDEDTDEACIRTYIRYDGILKSPNMIKAMVSAWRDIASPHLKDVVLNEVRKEVERDPSIKSFTVLPELFQEPFQRVALRGVPETLSGTLPQGVSQGLPIQETGDRRQETSSTKKKDSLSETADAVPDEERREDVDELCSLLAALITENGSKATITKGWRDAARLMLDRDQRDLGQALDLIEWSQQDSFWRTNVLSMPKFREKYDQLRMKSGIGSAPKAGTNGHADPALDPDGYLPGRRRGEADPPILPPPSDMPGQFFRDWNLTNSDRWRRGQNPLTDWRELEQVGA